MTRALLGCGVLAAPLFLLVLLMDGATRPGFSLWRNGASQLGTGDRGWLQGLNFIICGVLVLGCAVGVRRALGSGPGGRWGPLLLGAAGVGAIVAGLVPTDPALGYPPGVVETITVAGRVHGLAGLALFFGLAGASFVVARHFARTPDHGQWASVSRAAGVLIIASATAAGFAFRLDMAGTLSPAPAGALELVALACGLAWLSLTAQKLRTRPR
jgi:hypothetical protein